MKQLQTEAIERIDPGSKTWNWDKYQETKVMRKALVLFDRLILNYYRVDGFLSVYSISTMFAILTFVTLCLTDSLTSITSFELFLVVMVIKFVLQKVLRNGAYAARQRVINEPLYRRAALIQSASRAFNSHFDYYEAWYNSVLQGADVDEAEADCYFTFIQKAQQSICRAEINFNLAMQRIQVNEMRDDRVFLIELMGILNQPSNDPIAELTDNRAGRILDEEDALVEAMSVLQPLRLDA